MCQSGYEVHVLTRTLPQRKALEYKEIQIHEFPHYGNLEHNVIGGIDDFEFLVRRCGFSHIICFTHIEVWSSYLCMMSHPRPKVIILPILSNYDDLAKRNILADAMRVLEKADHVCRLTKQSMEAQLLKVAKIPTHFIPQVVPRIERHMSFRSIFGIDEKTPLFTHVADSWSAHELSLLLNELRLLQGNWRLAIIGEPDNPQSFSALQQNIAGDKRMLLLGPTEQNVTNSAIAEANVVLLSCKSEGYPTAILKAMSLGIPWLANPGNTSIYELLGGFVAETTRFPVILPEIINRNDLTSKLGRLGRRNWRDCFSPQVVLSAFIELIENNGANMPNIQRPEHLGKEQTLLRSRLYEHIFFMHGIRLW